MGENNALRNPSFLDLGKEKWEKRHKKVEVWLRPCGLVITYELWRQNYEKVGVFSCRYVKLVALQNTIDSSQFFGAKPDLGSFSNGVAPFCFETREIFLTVNWWNKTK